MIVLASVISIFTSASGGGWWKLFWSSREWSSLISNLSSFSPFFMHKLAEVLAQLVYLLIANLFQSS